MTEKVSNFPQTTYQSSVYVTPVSVPKTQLIGFKKKKEKKKHFFKKKIYLRLVPTKPDLFISKVSDITNWP